MAQTKHTELKERVKAGKITAKAALSIMKKRKNWPQVQSSKTAKWMIAQAK